MADIPLMTQLVNLYTAKYSTFLLLNYPIKHANQDSTTKKFYIAKVMAVY
jgi:hypothetical protein